MIASLVNTVKLSNSIIVKFADFKCRNILATFILAIKRFIEILIMWIVIKMMPNDLYEVLVGNRKDILL